MNKYKTKIKEKRNKLAGEELAGCRNKK